MSGFYKYGFKEGDNTIGKKQGDYEPDITIAGVGIAKEQCKIMYNPNSRTATLLPNNEDNKKFKVTVNGELVTQPLNLEHGDRVLVGLHHYYLFVDPTIDYYATCEYEMAMKEANRDAMGMLQTDEEFDKKMKEMEEKIKQEQAAREEELRRVQEKLEQERIKQMAELKKQ